jgi:hypothetical protein
MLIKDDSFMEFFKSVEFSGSGIVTGTAITLVVSKEVVVSTLYLLPTFFNNTKMLNVTGLHLPDGMKLKGKENYQ